jgi:hypothetical protein
MQVLLFGGIPFDEAVLMWWNFVARSRDELSDAYLAWIDRAERFGSVTSAFAPIDAPVPFWLHGERTRT